MSEPAGELDLLRAYLRDRDVTCPVCGHNLRSAAGFACPECGGRLQLRVASMDMPHTWWITCVVAFAWPLGLLGTFAGAGAWAYGHQRLWGDEPWLLGAIALALIVHGAALLLTLRRRTRFIQRSLARQRIAATVCVVFSLAVVIGLLDALVQVESYW